jgi:hypothetical protein
MRQLLYYVATILELPAGFMSDLCSASPVKHAGLCKVFEVWKREYLDCNFVPAPSSGIGCDQG